MPTLPWPNARMRGHAKNNKITLTFGLLACVVFSAVAHAAGPRVGPLDGKRVESLPALATPLNIEAEKLTDTGFAERMEQAEDWATALYAWQKIADDSPAWAQADALQHVANAQQKLGYSRAAMLTYRRIVDTAAGDDARAEAYFHLLQLTDPADQPTLLVDVLGLLPQTPAGKAWKAAALYRSVWTEAQAGAITATYSLPQAEELKERVTRMDADLAAQKVTATRLGILPGLGHAYLGRPQSAASMLPVWALFGWAMFYALRRKQWPYALIWALAFFGIWLSGPAQARKLADTINADTRMAALNSWEDLMPAEPTPAQLRGEEEVQDLAPTAPVVTEVFGPADVSPAALLASATAGTLPVETEAPQPSPTLSVQMREDGKLQAVVVTSTQPNPSGKPAPKVEKKTEKPVTKPAVKPKAEAKPVAKPVVQQLTPAVSGSAGAWNEEASPTSYFNIRPAQ